MQLQQLQAEGKEIDEEMIRTAAAAAMARKGSDGATTAAAIEVVDGGDSLDSPASSHSHFTSLPIDGARPAKR